jgi:hypothetical protein
MASDRLLGDGIGQLSSDSHLTHRLSMGLIRLFDASDIGAEPLVGRREDIEEIIDTYLASQHLRVVRLSIASTGANERVGQYDLWVESATTESFDQRVRTLAQHVASAPVDGPSSDDLGIPLKPDDLTFDPVMDPIDTGSYKYRLYAGLQPENEDGREPPTIEIGDSK